MDFDSRLLTRYLDQLGLYETWTSILFTSFGKRAELRYIFEHPGFERAQELETDLISGLSIGEISVLYEFSQSYVDQGSRKSNGLYFTPDDVAAYMAELTSQFPDGRWLDPCSGIGNLTWHLVNQQEDPETFLLNNMVLSDRDELALLIARFLLTADFQKTRNRLFDELEPNFIVFDFLSVADDGNPTLFDLGNPLAEIPTHDYVIVNPPYLALNGPDTRFETAKCSDLYSYFLENIVKTSSGFVSVTPQSFTNAKKFEPLRRLLLDHFENLEIMAFDNVPGNLFRGIKFGSKNSNTANSIRAAITVAKPGRGVPKITSLLRWKSSERDLLFEQARNFLTPVPHSVEYFPKVARDYADVFEKTRSMPTLCELLQKKPSPHVLYVPSAPRYFISALRESAERSSQRTIFFRSEEDLLSGYLLLNSSLMYWWWRVRDGGMTLAQETIHSMPVPAFKVASDLVQELEHSEKVNRVYKMNAGRLQENVKHPTDLVQRLNWLVLPEHADLLLRTHRNSEFSDYALDKPDHVELTRVESMPG